MTERQLISSSDDISARLTVEGISHSVDHNGVVWIKLHDPAWIGISPSDEQPGSCWVVLHHGDRNARSVLAETRSYDWPADRAVEVIQEHLEVTAAAQRPRPSGPVRGPISI